MVTILFRIQNSLLFAISVKVYRIRDTTRLQVMVQFEAKCQVMRARSQEMVVNFGIKLHRYPVVGAAGIAGSGAIALRRFNAGGSLMLLDPLEGLRVGAGCFVLS